MLQNHLLKELQKIEILDSIGDPISIQDTNFRVLYQNKRHRENVGIKIGEYCYNAYQNKEHFVMAMSREHLPRKDVPASHVTSLRLWKLKKA